MTTVDHSSAPQGNGWWNGLAAATAVFIGLAALLVEFDGTGPSWAQGVGLVLVASWVTTGLTLGARPGSVPLGRIALAGAINGAVLCLCQAAGARGELSDAAADGALPGIRLSAAVLPAIALHLFLSLPNGHLATALRRRGAAVGYTVAGITGAVLCTDLDSFPPAPITALWVAALGVGVPVTFAGYRSATALDQRRLQWVGWGLFTAAIGILALLAVRLLVDWPDEPDAVALAMTAFMPIALFASALPRLTVHVDRLLTNTVAFAGLAALVFAVFALVELTLGRRPDGGERSVLLLSMVASGLVALAFIPTRRKAIERTNQLVYGTHVAPDEALRAFGRRLTRSIPLDELLLQLTENLRSSMALESAEVWTGQDGRYECAAGVPHRTPPTIHIGPEELAVVSRAGVSGGTWLDVWMPQLVGSAGSAAMRVAPIAHSGLLLGVIAVTRKPDGEPFSEAEDSVLTDIARQIGLALHNAQLDTALQASLDDLQLSNEQLQHSRARIVSAGDDERRKLERNLHDGAQQHLVALAVKLRLARDAVDDDPPDAIAMIDEIKNDVQTAIAELRALAHGIFPPLLASGGLREALPAAATRAALPTTVTCEATGRYGNDIEAAVYFCTLEALQNAGKHAGDNAEATVTVCEKDGTLHFVVNDDGAGFDIASGAANGHGFVNIADRLGAYGGTVEVTSSPGCGTTIAGTIPLP